MYSPPPRACSCGDISQSDSREYPTAKEVGRLAVALNPDREKSYFEETLKQLQRETDEFARTECKGRENGFRHVYFPSGMEPPEDADEVYSTESSMSERRIWQVYTTSKRRPKVGDRQEGRSSRFRVCQ